MNETSEPSFYVIVETVDVWHMFVANGSNLYFIMIFDESKKIKLNGGMSSKRKIEKVNALLRQRQNELVSSLAAETEEIHNTTVEMLNASAYSPERPLVIFIAKCMVSIGLKFIQWWISRSTSKPRSAAPKLVTAAIVLSTIAVCVALPSAILLFSAAYVMFSDNSNIYGLFSVNRDGIVYWSLKRVPIKSKSIHFHLCFIHLIMGIEFHNVVVQFLFCVFPSSFFNLIGYFNKFFITLFCWKFFLHNFMH